MIDQPDPIVGLRFRTSELIQRDPQQPRACGGGLRHFPVDGKEIHDGLDHAVGRMKSGPS
jgi:hypothetical protein